MQPRYEWFITTLPSDSLCEFNCPLHMARSLPSSVIGLTPFNFTHTTDSHSVSLQIKLVLKFNSKLMCIVMWVIIQAGTPTTWSSSRNKSWQNVALQHSPEVAYLRGQNSHLMFLFHSIYNFQDVQSTGLSSIFYFFIFIFFFFYFLGFLSTVDQFLVCLVTNKNLLLWHRLIGLLVFVWSVFWYDYLWLGKRFMMTMWFVRSC